MSVSQNKSYKSQWFPCKHHSQIPHLTCPVHPCKTNKVIIAVVIVITHKGHKQMKAVKWWQVVTLLLHQHRSQEALSHFQQHLAAYRHPPPQLAPLPLAAGAAHWGWVGRQYQVMGELMNSRVDPAHLPPQV